MCDCVFVCLSYAVCVCVCVYVCVCVCEVGHCMYSTCCSVLSTVARHHIDGDSRHQIGLKLNLLCYFLSGQQGNGVCRAFGC